MRSPYLGDWGSEVQILSLRPTTHYKQTYFWNARTGFNHPFANPLAVLFGLRPSPYPQ
jgi:hypothetical protein